MYDTKYTVHAADRDVGKLLGKRGKTISAIRDLCEVIGNRTGNHYTIWVRGVSSEAMCVAAK